jgi:hypothetical protein
MPLSLVFLRVVSLIHGFVLCGSWPKVAKGDFRASYTDPFHFYFADWVTPRRCAAPDRPRIASSMARERDRDSHHPENQEDPDRYETQSPYALNPPITRPTLKYGTQTTKEATSAASGN